METVNQREAVKEQYKTTDNLNIRISIHEKYSTNQCGFHNWQFSHYVFAPGDRILELGCGTGDLWKGRLPFPDQSMELVLTDFSGNMVSAAEKKLGRHDNVSYDIASIESIPYGDHCFDKVIANMMLYHVPDLEQALSEVRRVMTGEGYFYCATYGENGIVPFIASLLKEFGVAYHANKNFTLQNGYGILKKYFSQIQRLDYEDSLAVTDVEDVLDYIGSLTMFPAIKPERQVLKKILEKEMVNGVLHIPKEYGMFICRV